MENKELEMKKAPVVLDEEELEGVSGGRRLLPVKADQKDSVSALEEIINNTMKD